MRCFYSEMLNQPFVQDSMATMPAPDSSVALTPTGKSRLWRRTLGFERLFCAFHDQSGCGRAIFLARFTGPREESAIERALLTVTQHCPRAAVRVARTETADYELQISDPPVFAPVEFIRVRDADHGCEVAAELGSENFPPGVEPTLRWFVLLSDADESFQIVCLAHHALFDGFSLAILVRRFLEVLGSSSIPAWNWPEPKVPSGQWRTYLRHLSCFARFLGENIRLVRASKGLPRDHQVSGTGVIHRWTEAETEQLVAACRKSETTVTAALGIAGILAVYQHYENTVPAVDVEIPVNIRRYLDPKVANDALGLMIIALRFGCDFSQPVNFTDQVRRITKTLRECVETEIPLRIFHLMNRFIPKQVRPHAGTQACVSANSLGQFDMPESPSGVRLMECGWFGNGGPQMPGFSQSASTVDGRLSITSYSSWIAGDRVRAIAAEVDRRLREFAGLPAAMNAPAVEELAATMS